jgi:hypothetical protein
MHAQQKIAYCKFLVDFGVRGRTPSYLSPQNQ